MKRLFIILVVGLLFTNFALSQEQNLPKAGLLPDSSFYFLQSWKESIQTFFTFGLENKAKQYLHLTEVRLDEYRKMLEKGKTEIAERTLEKYQNQLNRALQKAEKLKNKGKDMADLNEKIEQTVSKHLEVLQENLQKAPEQAKKGIENAIENSQKQIEKITGKKDETAGWQAYRNEKYGFEVKYPPTLRVWENQQLGTVIYGVSFENPLADRKTAGRKIVFSVAIFNNPNQLQEGYKSLNLEDQGETIIDGYRAQKLFRPLGPDNALTETTVYLIPSKNTSIHFQGADFHKISEADMNQILSTFRFIEQDETADWKTYRNEKYGFEVKYPPKYKTVEDKYGWPHSLILFIEASGYAQSYDIAIELWNSESEWETEHKSNPPNLIKKVGNKYLTITSWNMEEKEINQILSTFKFISR